MGRWPRGWESPGFLRGKLRRELVRDKKWACMGVCGLRSQVPSTKLSTSLREV